MREKKNPNSAERLYKFFIYLVLIMLAVSIIIPVAWVFMASIKQNKEFYGNPWTLPEGFYFQNFIDAWNTAKMGDYMLNSVLVTALALVILLIVALPAAYCLSRFKFKGSKFLNAAFMGGLFINVNYIVVPIFLMLRDGDNYLQSYMLQQHFRLQFICCRGIFQHWHMIMKRRHILMEQVIVQRCGKLFFQWQNHLLLR